MLIVGLVILAAIGFAVWYFFFRKASGITAKQLIEYPGLILWEWPDQNSTYREQTDKLNRLLGEYLLLGNKDSGEDVRDLLLSMAKKEFITTNGGTFRYSWFTLWAVEIAENLFSMDEIQSVFDTFLPIVKAQVNSPEAWKQCAIAPFMDFLRQKRPLDGIPATTGFINAKDHQPVPTEASSHYGPFGWLCLLIHSQRIGKLTPELADIAGDEFIRHGAVSRFAYGREWFRIQEGGTWIFTLGLFLMTVCSDEMKGKVKSILEKQVKYAMDHDFPVSMYAPLIYLAKWDKVKSKDAGYPPAGLRSRKLSDGRLPGQQSYRAYRSDEWWKCKPAFTLATIENEGIAVTLNLSPLWSGKGDFGVPGEVVSICDGSEEIINSPFSTANNPPQEAHSARVYGQVEVRVDHYDQENLQISANGWSRVVQRIENGVQIKDNGPGRSRYRLVNVTPAGMNAWENASMTVKISGDAIKATFCDFANPNGFYSRSDYVIEAGGETILTIKKRDK
jgi:hypothetical protein